MTNMILVDIILLSEGDSAALECLIGMVASKERREMALRIIPVLHAYKITGKDLGVLFRDLADASYDKMLKICENINSDILINLCRRRDGKGKQLMERYLLLGHIGQN